MSLHKMTPERRREVQSMGGKAISKDRARMAMLGKMGGTKSSNLPGWMAHLARLSHAKRRAKKEQSL